VTLAGIGCLPRSGFCTDRKGNKYDLENETH
jgi:hypothetical protein